MVNGSTVVIAVALGGSIMLAVLLTILNAVIYIDPALVFILMVVAILVLWSLWNRWEGDKQRQRIESKSHTLGPDAAEQERLNPD